MTESLQIWKRIWAWLVQLDIEIQDDWFGGEKETISAHLGYVQIKYGGKIPWRRPIQAALSRVLDWLDPGHCKREYEKYNSCRSTSNK